MKKISDAVIRRLPKYYRYLVELEKQGVEKISSGELSEKMGLNASQIRQDLNCFGGFGQQGFGYVVKVLKGEIQTIIGLDKEYSMIVAGAGNIGRALSCYRGFSNEGFRVIAVFDADPNVIGREINGVTVRDSREMQSFLKQNRVDIGIICTPEQYAQTVADVMIENGVGAIWNFAPIDLVSEVVNVENVHLSDSLFTLTYRLNEKQKNI